jgi:hypothetical protein
LVTNLETKKTVHWLYPFEVSAICIDETNKRILAGCTDGYIRELLDPDETDDDGTTISWQIQSKAWTDQVRKYFPRYAKYDVEIESGSAATGTILLDDTSKQAHTLASRTTRKRLIDSCNGNRLAVRISGTGPASVYQAEVE